MRLSELEPHWITEFHAGGHREDQVTSAAEAQGVRMLCPKCFAENGGSVGTHSVLVPFQDRAVPAEAMPQMPRWAASGSTFEDLSTTPSILLKGGCGWHGFITKGDVTTC
jgi:hypothetical protein